MHITGKKPDLTKILRSNSKTHAFTWIPMLDVNEWISEKNGDGKNEFP
jgi:hypothetical protein